MQPSGSRTRRRWIFFGTVAIIAVCRLWLALDVPLTDTTESRYAEMSRKMVETGDWLMPQHDYGVPYLAKPPLAMWMSAAGIELLGPGELGPRLLILLSAAGFLAYFYQWVRREIGPGAAATGVLLLMGSMLFFAAMAAVMTDLVLIACVDIALLAFWRRMHGGGPGQDWLLFGMIGLGLLTKGPLAAFLVMAPIIVWALTTGRLVEAWRRVAWVKGSLFAATIALPWYAAAEWQHPGFLRYFLLGENLGRFLVADWKGDLYGSVHDLPHGTIWLFLLIASLPWSVIGGFVLFRARDTIRAHWEERRELTIFALAAAGVPMVLFTVAQNVLFPYALPAIVPGVIAVLVLLGETTMTPRFSNRTAAVAAMTALVFVAGSALLHDRVEAESERELVTAATTALGAPADSLIYWQKRRYSAEYYTQGQVEVLQDLEQMKRAIDANDSVVIAMSAAQFDALPADVSSSLHKVGDYSKKGVYTPARPARIETHTAVRQ